MAPSRRRCASPRLDAVLAGMPARLRSCAAPPSFASRRTPHHMPPAGQCCTLRADSSAGARAGIHLIHLGKTLEKMKLAARMIVTIENPADVTVVSARPYGQRSTLKYSQYTGSMPMAGRFTPGSFTNYMVKAYREPRMIIVTDPRTDSQV